MFLWFKNIFARIKASIYKDASAVITEETPTALALDRRVKQKQIRIKTGEPKQRGKSIRELKLIVNRYSKMLDKTDFIDRNHMSINTDEWTIKALRTLGPFVFPLEVDSIERRWSTQFEGYKDRDSPSIMFVGIGEALRLRDKEKWHDASDFVFAVEVEKEQFRHVTEWVHHTEKLYLMGNGFLDKNPPKGYKKCKGKIVWVHTYAAYDKNTGKTRIIGYKTSSRISCATGSYSKIVWINDRDMFGDDALALLMNVWMEIDSHWIVEFKHHDNRITAAIPQNEAKYYFADREIDDNGKRKAIFHWVIAHYRKTKKGITTVKTHTRGNRHFEYGRFKVSIFMPHKHRYMISDFTNCKSHFEEPLFDDAKKFIPMKDAIKHITAHGPYD